MGFLVCTSRPYEANRFAIKPLQPLLLGGRNGLFAKLLPGLANESSEWKLSPEMLLSIAGFTGTEMILFDLTPQNPASVDYYELRGIQGRTMSLVTNALFQFKVVCGGARARFAGGVDGELIVPDWSRQPTRYEQLQLDGGTRGGAWSWSEPSNAMSATLL
jgi:hypothetical protein